MKELSLHILDIAQNAITAGAGLIEVTVTENTEENSYNIEIRDNGCGMTQDVINRVTDPYYTSRSTRKVGLGIPLFLHTARQAGGDLQVTSEPGSGTLVVARFIHDHIDRPGLGDMPGVMSMLSGANPEIDFIYTHMKDEQSTAFDTRELRQLLDGVPLSELPVIRFMREMISENLVEINVESRKSESQMSS